MFYDVLSDRTVAVTGYIPSVSPQFGVGQFCALEKGKMRPPS